MKKKFLWINLSVVTVLFIVTGLITALILASPIKLTQDEIDYYTETAENIWYNGLHSITPNDDIVIKYDLDDKTVRVSDIDTAKQSVTVDFSGDVNKVTINKPQASFIGCFLFFGFIWTLIIYVVINFTLMFISDRKNKKKQQNTQE